MTPDISTCYDELTSMQRYYDSTFGCPIINIGLINFWRVVAGPLDIARSCSRLALLRRCVAFASCSYVASRLQNNPR